MMLIKHTEPNFTIEITLKELKNIICILGGCKSDIGSPEFPESDLMNIYGDLKRILHDFENE